jgi:predicted transposase YbfD/YdcC
MRELNDIQGFLDFFASVPDHRINRKKLYSVGEILLLTFCGLVSGCNSWEDLEFFGVLRLEFLRKYLPYKNGSPSDDTLRRFFRVLDPKTFELKFQEWINKFGFVLSNKVIAIDGKTSRRSHDGDIGAIHTVSAFMSESKIVLGQQKVNSKSNEIIAIPELLDMIDISGAIITIDAMGTQHEIANKIIDKQANYVLSLKGNQSGLFEAVRTAFQTTKVTKTITDIDSGHGRIETRTCTISNSSKWLKWVKQYYPKWSSIKSLVKIDSIREIKGRKSLETRYYISSLKVEPEVMLNIIRQHWGVESMHWVLDVTFGDDNSRVRKGYAPQNILTMKKAALNLLQMVKAKYPKIYGISTSIARLRKVAGWTEELLLKVLTADFDNDLVKPKF